MGGFSDLRDSVFLLRVVIHEFGARGMRVTIQGGVREVHVGIGAWILRHHGDLCSDLVSKITCQYGARAYLRLWLRTPASTLPTRFPAALGIGHGLPAA